MVYVKLAVTGAQFEEEDTKPKFILTTKMRKVNLTTPAFTPDRKIVDHYESRLVSQRSFNWIPVVSTLGIGYPIVLATSGILSLFGDDASDVFFKKGTIEQMYPVYVPQEHKGFYDEELTEGYEYEFVLSPADDRTSFKDFGYSWIILYLTLDLESCPDYSQNENHTVFYYQGTGGFSLNVYDINDIKYNGTPMVSATPQMGSPRAGTGRRDIRDVDMYYDRNNNVYRGKLLLHNIEYTRAANGSYYDWVAMSPNTMITTPGKAYDPVKYPFIDRFVSADFALFNTYKIHSESISGIVDAQIIDPSTGRHFNSIYISPLVYYDR